MDNEKQSCCFTGHRRIESGHLTLLRQKLQSEITSLAARKGVKAFMAGGALGFDTRQSQRRHCLYGEIRPAARRACNQSGGHA